jgi:hypothetical protein
MDLVGDWTRSWPLEPCAGRYCAPFYSEIARPLHRLPRLPDGPGPGLPISQTYAPDGGGFPVQALRLQPASRITFPPGQA